MTSKADLKTINAFKKIRIGLLFYCFYLHALVNILLVQCIDFIFLEIEIQLSHNKVI